jgi:membrane protease YdiL (CAAX protease family)
VTKKCGPLTANPKKRPWTWWNGLELALTEIEESDPISGGRLNPHQRVTVVYATGVLVLLLMNYATTDVSVQVGASQSIVAAIGALSPSLDAWLFPFRGLVAPAVWSVGCFVCYFVIPALVVRTVLGLELRDFGLRWENMRGSLKLFAALYLPLAVVVIAVAQTPAFQTMYPFYRDPVGLGDASVWALLYALQFFALEFFFRGFLCHGVRDLLGRHTILLMTVPYVMIHFPKPMFEAIGAVGAGLVLGFLSLRTRSIALGVALHVAVAWTMDVAALLSR